MSKEQVGMIDFICLHDLYELFPKGRWSDSPSPIVMNLVDRGLIDRVGDHFTLSKSGKEAVTDLLTKHERKDKYQKAAKEVTVKDDGEGNVTIDVPASAKGFFDV